MLNVRNITTPAYICEVDVFKKNIEDFRQEVKRYYPSYRMGYSFKTNYYEGFCKAVNELGEYAEVVSPKEYAYAKSLGFRDQDIIYNGLIEDFDNKRAVAAAGGIVNIDNLPEFKKFVDWTNRNNTPLALGVRLNFDIGNGIVSRFGIDVKGEDFAFLRKKSNYPLIKIVSVHCHISQARSLEFFKRRVFNAAYYAEMLGAKYVDIGGNMFGRMRPDFEAQFPEKVPTFQEYAEVIGQAMADACPSGTMTLITEDGTPVVSNAMHLLATITNVKKVQGQTFIVVDTKREDVGASCITKIPSCVHYGKDDNIVSDATVFGCTCVEIDYILRKYNGPANIGDKLMFMGIGAYSNNTTNNFITPACRNYVEGKIINEKDGVIV